MKSKSNNIDIKDLTRIVVKFQDKMNIPYGEDKEISDYMLEKNMISWKKILLKYSGISISKLFTTLDPGSLTEMVDKVKISNTDYKPPNFLTYFAIDCPEGVETDELLKEIWKDENIEYVYEESGPTDPPVIMARNNILSANQGYLDAAPNGIDAMYAWNFGGDGSGNIKFIDIEQGWDLEHEDLPKKPSIQLLSGESHSKVGHGTSVLGIILAQDNNIGCVGITPFVSASVISQFRQTLGRKTLVYNTADAISAAVHALNSGDVLLIESQIVLKRSNRFSNYPSEVEHAIFHAIELGTNKGIIIIEPAGNGSNDLDTFKNTTGKFVLKRSKNSTGESNKDFKDSGAIMVAGAGSAFPHIKDASTNYGSRIDCYAWGENIQTTGDGENGTTGKKYIPDFAGTSGASAIIAGAAISVQSMRIASGGQPRYGPGEMRDILSNQSNGTPSKKITDNIGIMPDLKYIHVNVI